MDDEVGWMARSFLLHPGLNGVPTMNTMNNKKKRMYSAYLWSWNVFPLHRIASSSAFSWHGTAGSYGSLSVCT